MNNHQYIEEVTMRNRVFTLLTAVCVISASLVAQKDTVVVPGVYSGGSDGSLNSAIEAKISAGTLSNTVFKLNKYDIYPISGVVNIPVGHHLEIYADPPGTAQTSAPPQIVWTVSDAPNKQVYFECYGNLTMKNIWLRYADASGAQVGTCVRFYDDPNPTKKETGIFENVIFDYSSAPAGDGNTGGAVTVTADHFVGIFKNCYFKNCIDTHLRYYGRALSFPYNTQGWHNDSVYFENCTFANMGYVYMQEQAEYGDNVHFNHCTFLNIMMFTLESGWWNKLSVTNSLFVNTFMFGAIPASDGEGFGGTIAIAPVDSFGFAVPFTDFTRRILFSHSNYFVEQWLVDWMGWEKGNPYSKFLHANRRDDEIPVPMPMMNSDTKRFFDSVGTDGKKFYPYINKTALYDGVNPEFVKTPTNLDSLKTYLYGKWEANRDGNWSWKPEQGYAQLWPFEENLSYANTTLKTAAMGGFPLGDLYRWWPNEYQQWASQRDAEWQKINQVLTTGDITILGVERLPHTTIPSEFILGQNYPNPFNPSTKIEYSVPRMGHVSLKIYNLVGQEVATLYDGMQSAGNYVATFNGKNLSSGVYFYRLEADQTTLTKKLVLMK